MRCPTWCHRRPVETPSSGCWWTVRVEEDVHGVAVWGEDGRQEVIWMRRFQIRVATAPVHQGCPIPFYDFDKVAWTGGRITVTRINCKASELQPQHLPTLYFYPLRFLEVVRITLRVVWRGDNTCEVQSSQLNSTKGTFQLIISTSLTLAATAVCRANRCRLPESWSSGRVRDTGKA